MRCPWKGPHRAAEIARTIGLTVCGARASKDVPEVRSMPVTPVSFPIVRFAYNCNEEPISSLKRAADVLEQAKTSADGGWDAEEEAAVLDCAPPALRPAAFDPRSGYRRRGHAVQQRPRFRWQVSGIVRTVECSGARQS